jgi:glutamate-ammonia-ligase adenylyltransferase
MTWDLSNIPSILRPDLEDRLARLAASADSAAADAPSRHRASLPFVWACSHFVAEACLRDRGLLAWLFAERRLDEPASEEALRQDLEANLDPAADDAQFMDALRRFRRRQLARIAWRDLANLADIETVLGELSLLADVCIRAACGRAGAMLEARHGVPRGADGSPLELLVLGMGKLGGGELNFSSDIDLVFLFPEHGETTGSRPLEHEEYFARLARRVAQMLGSVTDEGFVYRVDLRLRPFGDSGPQVVSFDALEDYLQQHGRDWERYAYVKARPVHGAGPYDELYRNVLRPFVFRRYLDFSVFESLREMKDLISREVERRELRDNVKLGPGGIREIEFVVQAFQLIRGGGKPALQTRRLLEALPLLAGQKLLSASAVEELGAAYRFLRRVENRLQERNDEQTHDLPRDDAGRARLALGMGATDWPSLEAEIERHRRRVSAHFQSLIFAPVEPGAAGETTRALETLLEPEIDDARRVDLLGMAGIVSIEPVLERLNLLRDSTYYRRLDETGRRRLHTVLPSLLQAIAGGEEEALALGRVIHVIERIGGRTVYLALLNENAIARRRLVELCAHSQFLTDQIAAFPLLLDELLDERLFETTPTRAEFEHDLRARMAGAGADDPEQQVDLLRQFQRAAMFRVAVPDLTGRLPLMKVSDRLTDIAELIVAEALSLSWEQIVARHGVPCCGADGSNPAQAGMIEVETRLRPSGKGGMLVQSIEGFGEYQRGDAWTWEHQALLRARVVAGPPALRARFEALRRDLLRFAIRRDTLREDVRAMRERMRAELSRSGTGQFDLKQDAGGITDIEFLAQYWTLRWSERYPELVTYSDNIRQLESLASADLVPQATVDVLTGAYRAYRQRMHHLSLEAEESVVPGDEFDATRAAVTEIWNAAMK